MAPLILVYLRVSTEEQAKKGHSLPEQQEACQAKAREIIRQLEAERGHKVDIQVREFVDSFGGDLLERPVLEEVRALVRTQRVTHLVCLDPDRFSRSLKWQLIVADEIEGRGTRLVFVQQEYNPDDMMSRAFFQFRGLMSEIDKAKILERTSRGKRGKVKSGRRPNGAAPYGYRHIKETDELEIYEPEARWVRAMFEWVETERIGIHLVAKRLNELGVTTRRGGDKWYRSTVREMLMNTSYAGEMTCYRRDTRGLGAIRRLPREKRRALTPLIRPREEWATVPTPVIVDRRQFDEVQEILAGNPRRGRPRCTGLLSKLARCGHCGGPMSYARSSDADRTYIRCIRKYAHHLDYRPGTAICPMRHHRAERIEAEIWAQICRWLTEPGLLEEYRTSRSDASTVAGDQERLDRRLATLEEQLGEKQREQLAVIQAQARRLISEDLADQQLEQLQRHVERVEAAIVDARLEQERIALRAVQHRETAERFGEAAREIVTEQETIQARLASLSRELRHELGVRLIRSVTIHQDGRWEMDPH